MLSDQSNRYRQGVTASILVLAVFLGLLGINTRLVAAPISREQALEAAYAWLSLSPQAMHQRHGQLAGTVTPVWDTTGQAEFYAVDLKPKGFVIVAADDAVEPIIAFSSTEVFQAVPGHPLFEMLRGDLPGRLARARSGVAAPPPLAGKWQMLRRVANAPKMLTATAAAYYNATGEKATAAPGINDVRVSPLIESTWDQLTSSGQPVYNYYTPPYSSGDPNNYYAGCLATMFGQIMRFHQWPQTGVGTGSYKITVNHSTQNRSLRGGDGAGGSYVWANMPLSASDGMPAVQEQAIGALLADAGVASNMDYEPSASGAFVKASVLTRVFHYANAAFSSARLSGLEVAIKANLDAGLPVGLAISDGNMGHAVVADGYGYNATTLYHHLNMGWSGANDAWYNLPTVDVGFYDFTVVNGAVYNIDPLVPGEIVSGRIADRTGQPIADLPLTVSSGSVIFTATTNAAGIYAVKGLSSNTTWTITPNAEGWAFTPAIHTVTTGRSSLNGAVGDRTGLDFKSRGKTGSVAVQINAGAVANGAKWRVDRGRWNYGPVIVSGVPVGTHTLSFRAVKGWTPPASYLATVLDGQTTTVPIDYVPLYSLSAASDNPAYGQVSANPAPGELGSYSPNTNVVLRATAAAGYYFGGWLESGTLVSMDATYPVVVRSARLLVASFPPTSLTGQNTQVYLTSNKGAAVINVLPNLSASTGTAGILTVTQPANGTVTVNADGTLTFTPGRNFHGSTQFSYSAGDGNGGTITRAVTINNWFAASAGAYAGLSLAGELTNEATGYLKTTLTASGAFSGKLAVAGVSYPLSGAFDSNANYQKMIARPDGSHLAVQLHLEAALEISGTISDGVTSSEVIASRLTFSARNKAPQAGKYTALLSGSNIVPGDGYFNVTILPTGNATVTGRLADGTPVSTGAFINADGSVPYYFGVYKSSAGAGSVLGTMVFEPKSSTELTGVYAWFRPGSTSVYYPDGFQESGSISGSLLPPVATPPVLQGDQAGIITVQLSGGGLTTAIDETGQPLPNGKIAWSTSNDMNLTLTVGPTGKLTGSFVDPATGKKRLLEGIWLPKLQLGGGFFLGDSSAGALSLSGQ